MLHWSIQLKVPLLFLIRSAIESPELGDYLEAGREGSQEADADGQAYEGGHAAVRNGRRELHLDAVLLVINLARNFKSF